MEQPLEKQTLTNKKRMWATGCKNMMQTELAQVQDYPRVTFSAQGVKS
jgi:hypothetical protein